MIFTEDFNSDDFFKKLQERIDKTQYEISTDLVYPTFENNPELITQLSMEYFKEKLLLILEHENFGDNPKALLNTATASFYYFIVEPYLEKILDEKVKKINGMITQFEFTREHIVGNTIIHKFEEVDYIIYNLTFDTLQPSELFDTFLEGLEIEMQTGNKQYAFRYSIPNHFRTYKRKKWYYCNTIVEMLNHLREEITQPVINHLIEMIREKNNTTKPVLLDDIDIALVESLETPEELYDYLKAIDIARIVLPLDWLYVLTNYKTITEFAGEELVKHVKSKIYMYRYRQRYINRVLK